MKELTKVQAQTAEKIKQVKEEMQQVKEQLHVMADTIASSAQTSPQPSYADVARSPPTSQLSNVRTLSSMRTTPSLFTDTLFCTIDTSRVIREDRGKAQVGEVRQAIEEKVRARVAAITGALPLPQCRPGAKQDRLKGRLDGVR
jgi:hypothetical protein